MQKLIAILAMLAAAPAIGGPVEIEVTDVHAAKGGLYVTLQTRDQFMTDKGLGDRIARPAPGNHRFVFSNVPAGTYAVSVWHDVDGDGVFSKDPARGYMPTDGWAMVNGDQLRAEPRFDQVSVTVGDKPMKLTLPVRYEAEAAK